MKIRKHLSADGLFRRIRGEFEKIREHRSATINISLADALMSGFAMFTLKDPSLLAFDERRVKSGNLRQVFGIQTIPSDTQMRNNIGRNSPGEFSTGVQGGISAVATGQGVGKDDLYG